MFDRELVKVSKYVRIGRTEIGFNFYLISLLLISFPYVQIIKNMYNFSMA